MRNHNLSRLTTSETAEHFDGGVGLAREHYDLALIQARAQELIDSHEAIEHDNWELEPEVNARTAIFEELTAKGHLSRVAFEGGIDDVNQKTLRRLLNGWSDRLPDWEKKRRFYELVEELIIQNAWQDIVDGRLPPDTIIFTISDYPEEASDEFAHLIGYRSLNKKGMVRGTHFETDEFGNWTRVNEQISRSNSLDRSSTTLMRSIDPSTNAFGSSLDVLSNQILASRRTFPDGVVDLQRVLDKNSGPNVLYGEFADHQFLPAYEELRELSARRESQAEHYTKRLASFERQLNYDYKSGRITYDQKLAHLNRERTKIVDEICLLSPDYAHDARGEKSAKLYRLAALSMASGDHGQGARYLQDAIAAKDPRAAAVCGGVGSALSLVAESQAESEAKAIYASARENKTKWKWRKGYCIVDVCGSKNKFVEVGPCSVCRDCQDVFDGNIKVDVLAPIKEHLKSIEQARAVKEANEQARIAEQTALKAAA